MGIRNIGLAVPLLAAIGLACSSSSGPSDPGTGTGACITDFSCAADQECNGGGCASIAPALRPYIQTASCLLRSPIDDNEAIWRATHFDLLIAQSRPDIARSANPNVRLFEYVIARYNRFDDASPRSAMQWASGNGYNGEDFYLHYKEDTYVPTWEGREIVPGFAAGMVPGWVPGGPVPGASATTRAQSRVVGYYTGGPPWYMANVGNAGYQNFLKDCLARLIAGDWWTDQKFASGPVDGLVVDEAIWYPLYKEGVLDHSAEYYGIPVNDSHPYTYAIENLYPTMAAAMRARFNDTKDIMPNYGHVLFLNFNNRCAQNIQKTTPWIWGEVWMTYTGASSPTSGSARCMSQDNDYDNGVRQIVLQTRKGGRRVFGMRDMSSGIAGTDRGKLLGLGLYYLVHNARTYYMYESALNHNSAGAIDTWGYNPAVEFDVGQPDQVPAGFVDFDGKANTKEHYELASGPDPVNASLTYHVYARNFTNAVVLVKLLPIGSTVGDASATTHDLGGYYAPLLADGTPGAPLPADESTGTPVTHVQIRNNEALILVKL